VTDTGSGERARRGEFSAESTKQALAEACGAAGLDSAGAELLRLGENAIYRLRSVPLVARIARTVDYLPDIVTEVAVARWLASADFPSVRLAGPDDQPVVADGRVVTFWELVSEREEYGTVRELGLLLRQLHDLVPPSSLVLPELEPFRRVEPRIRQADLPEEDRLFLRSRLEELRGQYVGLQFALPPGPVHGDANIGNILRRQDDGRAVLIDLDGFADGPREWDLVLTAMYYERFGWHTAEEYAEFTQVYGFDVMAWPGYRVLRDIRELIMVTWLAQNTGESQRIAAEVRKRIVDLRGGDGRRDWAPY
jgi:Ser/Thr protein kinase RdoA (MazF antagonist)